MKTILIIDDDYIARSKITALLEWEKCGYNIIGEASNGKEALEMMRETVPDIALVDMDMPVMNGVELIREIKKRSYPTAVIVLSSYNDFDYVRESMKLGALDYILKNEISSEVLLTSLSGIQDSEKNLKPDQLSAKDREYIRELYMRRILLNTYSEEENIGWISEYNLPLDPNRNMLAVFEIDDYMLALRELDEKGIFTFQQFAENLVREEVHKIPEMSPVKMKEARYCLVLSCREIYSIHEGQQILIRVMEDIKRNFIRYLNLTITGSVGSICLGLGGLEKSYKMIEKRLRSKFFAGKGNIILGEDAAVKYEEGIDGFDAEMEALVHELYFSGEKGGVGDVMQEIFTLIRKVRPEEKKVKRWINEILGRIEEQAKAEKVDFFKLCGSTEIYMETELTETLGEIEKRLGTICAEFGRALEAKEDAKKYSKLTGRAIEYLERNFKDRISLSETAEYLNVSSSHLSRVFKNDTGMNLVTYLNHIRIAKAQSLLQKGDMSIKLIAYETGFNNYNHFFATFKNLTGMSPQEYQEEKSKK